MREWTESDAKKDGYEYEPGYYGWEIANVRGIANLFKAVAQRKIYKIDVPIFNFKYNTKRRTHDT